MAAYQDHNVTYYRDLIEETAEDLYENAPCGYLSTLPDGSIVKVNSTFLKWIGYEREELLTKRFQDLLSIGGKIFYETHHGPLIRIQGFVNELFYDIVHKNGSVTPILLNSVQLSNIEGKPIVYRTTLFNITERKKYEKELLYAKQKAEEAAKIKTDFLSTVSHEIRTPMNAILGITNLLLEDNLSTKQREYVNILKYSSQNLLDLINDVLDFHKIEAGKVAVEFRDFNLRELIFNTLYSLGIKAEEKGLQVSINIDNRIPEYINGDPLKLSQILINLLGNAIKFTEIGHVSVDVFFLGDKDDKVRLQFAVSDTGIGIPEDKIEKVFEEFTQANYEINSKYGGTGLGLAICQKLLAMFDSRMEVESKLGKGSKFSFELNLNKSSSTSYALGAKSSLPIKSIKGLKVLLAEDNEINVFVVSQFLNNWETDFSVAENGQEALEMVRKNDYDVILMDLNMPVMDGYEATLAIRKLGGRKYKQLPIIALSASAKSDLKDRLEYSGMNSFVSKPFNPKELYDVLALYSTKMDELNQPSILPEKDADFKNHGSSGQPIDLSHYRVLVKNNPTVLRNLVKMIIDSFHTYKSEFQELILKGDEKEVGLLAHKLKMTSKLLKAEKLESEIQDARSLLKENANDKERLQKAIEKIHHEFDRCVSALEAELLNI